MDNKNKYQKSLLSEKDLVSAKGRFIKKPLMKAYTTIKVGGRAEGIYIPRDIKDLKRFLQVCLEKKISLIAIGNGSNILIADAGLDRIFLRLSSLFFKNIFLDGSEIICGPGVGINSLCNFAEEHRLGHAEFLVGIPGTVGGAVYQNAGAYSKSISVILKGIECMDSLGRIEHLDKKDIHFAYRHSGLKGKIIISVRLKLKRCKPQIIRKNTDRYLGLRLLSQDYTAPSAGCVFKNPAGHISAGEMIEKCGLKGKSIGDACVSKKHANFILNKGSADAKDILRLMRLIKKQVRSRYNVLLENEIEYIK
jgi:UDP-N-acetylmuramate dehydrogenase